MILIIGVIIGVATVTAAPAEFYQSRYDHVDIEALLNNRRMVNYYAACLLSKGPCPPQGLELKRVLPEALRTNCAKCTEKQKTSAYRAFKRLRKEYPKVWEQLTAVWDPDETYVRAFETSFENQNSISPEAPKMPDIFNRFGETDDASSSTSTTSTTTLNTSTKPTTKPTNKPFVSVTQKPIYVTIQPQGPPFSAVGANLHATVSFGTNLVGGIVRSLGTLGSKVVESGTKLANMVISAAFRN